MDYHEHVATVVITTTEKIPEGELSRLTDDVIVALRVSAQHDLVGALEPPPITDETVLVQFVPAVGSQGETAVAVVTPIGCWPMNSTSGQVAIDHDELHARLRNRLGDRCVLFIDNSQARDNRAIRAAMLKTVRSLGE